MPSLAPRHSHTLPLSHLVHLALIHPPNPRSMSIDKWSPALQIRTVLLSIQALLSAPNPDDPLATDVAKHYKEDEKAAQAVSRQWTAQYAS